MSDVIHAELIGALVGLAVSVPLLMVLQPILFHGENPIRFWAWIFGHWLNRPRWIRWGRTGRFGVHDSGA